MIPKIKGNKVYGIFCKDIMQMYSDSMDSITTGFSGEVLKDLDIRTMSIDEFRAEFIKAVESHG